MHGSAQSHALRGGKIGSLNRPARCQVESQGRADHASIGTPLRPPPTAADDMVRGSLPGRHAWAHSRNLISAQHTPNSTCKGEESALFQLFSECINPVPLLFCPIGVKAEQVIISREVRKAKSPGCNQVRVEEQLEKLRHKLACSVRLRRVIGLKEVFFKP